MQIEETSYTRLCSTKNILTVNGQFPGPTLHIRQGDTAIVNVYNNGTQNITIHWYAHDFYSFSKSSNPDTALMHYVLPKNRKLFPKKVLSKNTTSFFGKIYYFLVGINAFI